jgi:hypothetical protein
MIRGISGVGAGNGPYIAISNGFYGAPFSSHESDGCGYQTYCFTQVSINGLVTCLVLIV